MPSATSWSDCVIAIFFNSHNDFSFNTENIVVFILRYWSVKNIQIVEEALN